MTQFNKYAYQGGDDQPTAVVRRDISAGVNNRQHASNLKENQVASLLNADIGIPGLGNKRSGIALIEDLGNDAGTGALGFIPLGADNLMVVTHGTTLETSSALTVGGSSFTARKADFTSGLQTGLIKTYESGEDDVLLISNGTDNVFRMNNSFSFQDLGDTNTSPPLTTVMHTYRDRVWALKDELLYFSDASAADYSAAFDRTNNAFRLPVGDEKAIIGIRDTGLFVIGEEQIWGLNPSIVPDPTTDKPEKILEIGAAAGRSCVQVGDDIYFLAKDGIRGVKRTLQDKLQLGVSYPISYPLKDELATVNWEHAHKATGVWFDNMYLIALPVSGSSYNNAVWAFYPANNAWTVWDSWNVGDWAKITMSGEERLYYIDSDDGSVYRAFSGETDAGTAITYTEVGRKEDLGQPLKKKVAGELLVKCQASGSSNLDVQVSFDDGGFNSLGTMSLAGNLVTFPVTFPVNFSGGNIVYKKFHLDSYGAWYYAQIKLVHTGLDDLQILERTLVSYLEEYISEEEV